MVKSLVQNIPAEVVSWVDIFSLLLAIAKFFSW